MIATWPKCTHCGQSCTGSYVGVPKCHRCFARVRVLDYEVRFGGQVVVRSPAREDR